jgi:hypothetical protein
VVDSFDDSRIRRLGAAGFLVLEVPFQGAGLPSEREVWRRVSSSIVQPSYEVAHTADEGSVDLATHWRELAIECGAVSDDGHVLMGLTRADPSEVGWCLVALPEGPIDLDELGPNPGEPEFVAMSITGEIACAVTAEEYAAWIVCVSIGRDKTAEWSTTGEVSE